MIVVTSLTYVYCLVRNARRPSLRNAPPVIPGGDAMCALDAGDGLWIIATHVPARDYDEAALERGLQQLEWVGRRAMAHEAAVEHFLRARAVLPMQLFTLFTSDDRALAHVARDRRRINRVLTRIERKLEWGVRLTLDEKTVEAPARQGRSERRSPAGRAESGAAYLSRKRDQVDAHRKRLKQASVQGGRAYRALSREAAASVRRSSTEQAAPGSRLLVDAAFLVPVGRTSAFRAALRSQARALRASGLTLSATGPWPAYNFIGASGRGSDREP